ncbi:Malignant T-cell-amplified sequence 1 [Grifola frondosa]|uniref:Translation machinery-associated protein 20 n=1 Tax=Grifola frondosa TaxID=5627 RepID=A0A1C7ME64_GRIFR|nr:Malignant T-cell-amplified sequence 1 [Grifola frondosa]
MFKKFQPSTDVSGQVNVKSSVQRSIRTGILSQWKINPETFEQIWPKKESLILVKCREHISIYTLHGEPLFFQHFDSPFYPTLRLLHKYPFILPRVGVDRGAIRFLLAGAHMMCPAVAIYSEGKEHAVGIGITKLDTEEMRKVNKGVGVETVTYLGDDLWKLLQL